MSHYGVGIFIPKRYVEDDTKEDLESSIECYIELAMAPYEDCPEPGSFFLTSHDNTSAEITSYLNSTSRAVQLPNGEIVVDMSRFERPATKQEIKILKESVIMTGVDIPKLPYVINARVDRTVYNNPKYYVQVLPEGAFFCSVPTYRYQSFWDYLKDVYEESIIDIEDSCCFSSEYGCSMQRCSSNEAITSRIWPEYLTMDQIQAEIGSACEVRYYSNDNGYWDYYSIESRRDEIPTVDGKFVVACPLYNLALYQPLTEKQVEYFKRFWDIHIEGYPMTEQERKDYTFRTFHNKEYYLSCYETKENFIKEQRKFVPNYYITQEEELVGPGPTEHYGLFTESGINMKHYRQQFFKHVEKSDPEDVLVMVDMHV